LILREFLSPIHQKLDKYSLKTMKKQISREYRKTDANLRNKPQNNNKFVQPPLPQGPLML